MTTTIDQERLNNLFAHYNAAKEKWITETAKPNTPQELVNELYAVYKAAWKTLYAELPKVVLWPETN